MTEKDRVRNRQREREREAGDTEAKKYTMTRDVEARRAGTAPQKTL